MTLHASLCFPIILATAVFSVKKMGRGAGFICGGKYRGGLSEQEDRWAGRGVVQRQAGIGTQTQGLLFTFIPRTELVTFTPEF